MLTAFFALSKFHMPPISSILLILAAAFFVFFGLDFGLKKFDPEMSDKERSVISYIVMLIVLLVLILFVL